MEGQHQEIDLKALETRAKLAQSVNGFVSGYMKNRVCYSIMTIVLSLVFIAVTIGVLASTRGDCGLGGSIRAYLVVFLLLLIATLVVTFTFEVLIRRGTILKYPKIATMYGWAIPILTFVYVVMAIVGSVLLFGDGECYNEFYSGFVLGLVLLIMMYIGIALFACMFCMECVRKNNRKRRPATAV